MRLHSPMVVLPCSSMVERLPVKELVPGPNPGAAASVNMDRNDYMTYPVYKPKAPPKPIRSLLLSEVNEGVPGGLEVRYGDLKLAFHRLKGTVGICTIMEGKSKGKQFNLDARTRLDEYEYYYEADI